MAKAPHTYRSAELRVILGKREKTIETALGWIKASGAADWRQVGQTRVWALMKHQHLIEPMLKEAARRSAEALVQKRKNEYLKRKAAGYKRKAPVITQARGLDTRWPVVSSVWALGELA